jgi:predicted amidohydrolase
MASAVLKVAAVQMAPKLGAVEINRPRVLAKLEVAAGAGAGLIVFPECVTSGYNFSDLDAARRVAETMPGPTSEAVVGTCRRLGVHAVVGLLERAADRVYNSALLVGPEGLVACYRKTHLPCLGVDRFVSAGDRLAVHDTPLGRLGLLICYDLRFPEAARVLALQGADVIVHPTNWHWTSDDFPDFITRARARESRVYVVSADRWGHEGEARYLGRSQVVDVSGQVLAEAGREGDTILYADLDLDKPRQKHMVLEPGVFESDLVADRRPDLYGPLSERAR